MKKYNNPVDYFIQKAEGSSQELIGAEFEHLILNPDNSWVRAEEVAAILDDLVDENWEMETIEGVFLGLRHDCMWISLEPGSQFEISISPRESVVELDRCYRRFLEHVIPVIEKHGKKLVGVGFQPVTAPDDIYLIDKKRYHLMNQHFSQSGSMGYYMMRASAATQVAVDYFSEADFMEKFQLASRIGPYLALMFDSANYAKGEYLDQHLFRTTVWFNTDDQRSNLVQGGLDPDFGFQAYADHILNFEPILITDATHTEATGHQKTKDLIEYPIEHDLWEHYLSMAFFDVRAKGYLEIRMLDSIPYPYNMAAVALIKGIMYHPERAKIAEYFSSIDLEQHEAIKHDLIAKGYASDIFGFSAREVARKLYQWAWEGLAPKERRFLEVMQPKIENAENFRYGPEVSLAEAIRRNEVRL